jgi:hypothetical protein
VSPYRKIETRTYGDARFRQLSKPQPCGQYLWVWLLSCPATGIIPGLIPMGAAGLAELVGWPLEGFREAFQEVIAQGMIKADFSAPLVFIPKAIKHNLPQSPNVVLGWRAMWDQLTECDLKLEAWQTLKSSLEAYGKAFADAFEKACPKPLANQEQEQEQEQEKENSSPTPPQEEGFSKSASHSAEPPDVDYWQLAKAQLKSDLYTASLREPKFADSWDDYDTFFRDTWLDRIEGATMYVASTDAEKTRHGISKYRTRLEKLLESIAGHELILYVVDATKSLEAAV